MRYYLIDTAIEKAADDSEISTQTISVFGDPTKADEENKNAAIIAFHNSIAYKMQVEAVKSALIVIINEFGGIEKSEKYIAYVEPEPEEE